MQLFNKEPNIDFVGQRKLASQFSIILMVLAVVAILVRGLNLGIDFTGGTLIEVGYKEPASIEAVRGGLAEGGFPEAIVQHFGSSKDVLVRIAPRGDINKAELSIELQRVLEDAHGSELDIRRVEFVGPQVGDELREDGGLAMLIALAGILIYVSLRFEWRFAIGSVAALVHDVLITVGIFAALQLPFDLTVLAAVLAVIGYSLNDTIVVFDRVRENFRRIRKRSPAQVTNMSLNQTLSRTLMTSVTTLLVLFALFLLGGELIHGFATALIIGVGVGTYSSIYVASSAVLALGIRREDLLPDVKPEDDASEGTP